MSRRLDSRCAGPRHRGIPGRCFGDGGDDDGDGVPRRFQDDAQDARQGVEKRGDAGGVDGVPRGEDGGVDGRCLRGTCRA